MMVIVNNHKIHEMMTMIMPTKIQIFLHRIRTNPRPKNVICPRYFYALEIMGGLYANSFDDFIMNKFDEPEYTCKCKCMLKKERKAAKQKENKAIMC